MGAQEQIKYEYLLRELYDCRQGENPGVEADEWSWYEGISSDNKNNPNDKEIRNEYIRTTDKIKRFINDAIEFKINMLQSNLDNNKDEIDTLSDYKNRLDNANEFLSIEILIKDICDYFRIL